MSVSVSLPAARVDVCMRVAPPRRAARPNQPTNHHHPNKPGAALYRFCLMRVNWRSIFVVTSIIMALTNCLQVCGLEG